MANPVTIENEVKGMQEIIGKPPIWIIRVGTFVFLLFFFIILFGAIIIKVPEIVSIPITIKTDSSYDNLSKRKNDKYAQIWN